MRLQRHLPILTVGPRERAYPSAGQLPLPHRSGIREFMPQVQLLLVALPFSVSLRGKVFPL